MKPFVILLLSAAISLPCIAQNDGQIALPDMDPKGGADLFQAQHGHTLSGKPFDAGQNFFKAKSNKTLTILSHFHTMQQTTDWTCGNVAALMVMHYFGRVGQATEPSLAVAMHTMVDSETPGAKPGTARRLDDLGTHISEMYDYFAKNSDWHIVSSNYRPTLTADKLIQDTATAGLRRVGNYLPPFKSTEAAGHFILEQLKAGRPIMVDWNEWGGHWTVIIGLDNGGTPELWDDDVLIMADSYDTFDRKQDGYTVVPLTQFFSNWIDTLGPKPWQLQPYLVVEPARQD